MTTQTTFTIQIRTANDAFQDDGHKRELDRILDILSEEIRAGQEGDFTLYDKNGNRIGTAVLEVWEL